MADEELRLETEIAEDTGLFSPVSWTVVGLVALLLVAVALLAGQMLARSSEGSGIQPVAAPRQTLPAPR